MLSSLRPQASGPSSPGRLNSALPRYPVNITAPVHSHLNPDPYRMSSVLWKTEYLVYSSYRLQCLSYSSV